MQRGEQRDSGDGIEVPAHGQQGDEKRCREDARGNLAARPYLAHRAHLRSRLRVGVQPHRWTMTQARAAGQRCEDDTAVTTGAATEWQGEGAASDVTRLRPAFLAA